MILKNYQSTNSQKIKNGFNEIFEFNSTNDSAERILFVAPTGSGKTIIVSDAIKQFNNENIEKYDYTFVWISIGSGNLHIQSKEKVQKYISNELDTKIIDSENISNIGDRLLSSCIYFVNWESLNNKDKTSGEFSNIIMKDSEKTNFQDIIHKTHAFGTKIILIIDESHRNANTTTSKELIEFISPKIILEMTATPNGTTDYVKKIKITIEECIKEEMIKNEILINNFNNKKPSDSTDIIRQAISKRTELECKYKMLKINVNPLLLIQIGDGDEGKQQLDIINEVLKELNYDQNKIAKWFANQYENLENISVNDCKTEILIFKQAVATGWDAPRSQVLLKLRNSKEPNLIFELQTMGRILRMPEQKYYKDEILNKAYVYCESDNISVTSDVEKGANILKTKHSIINKIFKNSLIEIPSEYKRRVDYGDITSELIKKHLKKNSVEIIPATIYDLEDRSKYFQKEYNSKVTFEILNNYTIETPDVLNDLEINDKGKLKINIPERLIDLYFERYLRSLIGDFGFASVRSFPVLKNAIFEIFYKEFNIKLPSMVKKYILANKKLNEYLAKSVYDYKEEKEIEIEKKEKDAVEKSIFTISDEYFPDNYEKMVFKKNIYEIAYLKPNRSQIEKDFEQFLDKHSKVKYWYKNGDNSKIYFGINYQKDGIQRTFYPDFIVLFNDNSIGIYDTKLGFTTTDESCTEKYNGLKNYSSKYAKELKNIIRFGLVSYNSKNNFVLMMKANYVSDVEKWSDFDKCLD